MQMATGKRHQRRSEGCNEDAGRFFFPRTRQKELLEECFSFLPLFGNILNHIFFLECFFPKKTHGDSYRFQFTDIYSLDKIVSWKLEHGNRSTSTEHTAHSYSELQSSSALAETP